jgi:SAM-dependent methyltransferase
MNNLSPTQKLMDRLRACLADDTFVSLQLSGAAGQEGSVPEVRARFIHLQGQPVLSFIHHEAGRDYTRNLPINAGIEWIQARLETDYQNALLRTVRRDWQWHRSDQGAARLVSHKPSVLAAPPRGHDRRKVTLLDGTASDWLGVLGLLDKAGHPKPSMADKHRQIGRYLEILHHLARDCGWTSETTGGEPVLRLADMGCGKGYLTFAAWHLFHRILRRRVTVLGVERRTDLVGNLARQARQIQAGGLEFVAGDISTAPLPQLDILIALHACDTATDDALRRGINAGAKLIVVAPCCHQALRPEMGSPPLLAALLRHGLLKERLSEWLTDGLRTLFLEWAGFETKVIEFVASEHTPKNLMIAAIRTSDPFTKAGAREGILELKTFFGIQHHPLDDLLRLSAPTGSKHSGRSTPTLDPGAPPPHELD